MDLQCCPDQFPDPFIMAKYIRLLELARDGEAEAFVAAWRASGLGIDFAEPDSGVTALSVASEHRQADMVRTLLGLGADVNRASAAGNTALHFAARSGSPTILALLREAGAGCSVSSVGWRLAVGRGGRRSDERHSRAGTKSQRRHPPPAGCRCRQAGECQLVDGRC